MNTGYDPTLPHSTAIGADPAVDAFIVGLARKTELEQQVVARIDTDGGWFPGETAQAEPSEVITRPHLSAGRVVEIAAARPTWLTVTSTGQPGDLGLDGFRLDGCAPIMVRSTDEPTSTVAREHDVVRYRGGDHLAPLADVATWPTGRFRTDTDQIVTLVAEPHGVPVGYGQLVESTPGFGYFADLFVHPDHRGRGHATSLLNARLHLARERGMTHVVLSASDLGRAAFVANGFAVAVWYSVYRRIEGES
jgi:GNAT superfamily N-acetyltransferase